MVSPFQSEFDPTELPRHFFDGQSIFKGHNPRKRNVEIEIYCR